MTAKVCFADMRAGFKKSLLDKVEKLFDMADMGTFNRLETPAGLRRGDWLGQQEIRTGKL